MTYIKERQTGSTAAMIYPAITLYFLLVSSFLTNCGSTLLANPLPDTAISIADTSGGEEDGSVDSGSVVIKHRLDREVPNRAFQAGEKLTFNVRYGFIKAGEATMEVRDVVSLNDSTRAYHILSTTRSASFFDTFYKVRDSVETFVDTRGFFSWRFEKRLREGGYNFDLQVDYRQRHGMANVKTIRYHNDEPLRVKKSRTFSLEMPEYVMDVLASFYYMRTQPLETGMPIYITNHDNKKVYDLQVIVQRRERIKVDAGEFNCLVLSPRLQGEAIFQQKGELWIWVTDDANRIPVKMTTKVAVGSISADLKSIEGVPLPLRAQVIR